MIEAIVPGTRFAELPDVLTPQQVAAVLQISRKQVYTMCQRGELPAMKVGRLVRVPKAQLIVWIEEGG